MMRFGQTHSILSSLLATLGLVILVTSGEIGLLEAIGLLGGLAAALALPTKWKTHALAGRTLAAIAIALLIAQIIRVATNTSVMHAAIEYVAALQVLRIASRKGAVHDRQILVLALIHVIVGTALGGGTIHAISLVAIIVLTPATLLLSHLRREVEDNYRQGARDRTGQPVDVPRILRSHRVVGKGFLASTCLLSLPIFVFTAVLFLAFPRFGVSFLLLNQPTAERLTGFSDSVDLAAVGTIHTDHSIALRVHIPNVPDPPPARIALYLRGTAFDTFSGTAWSRSRTTRVPVDITDGIAELRRIPNHESDIVVSYELEPMEPRVLFIPQNAAAIRIKPRGIPLIGNRVEVLKGPDSEYTYQSSDQRGISYQAYLPPSNYNPTETMPPDVLQRYLALPYITDRTKKLTLDWTETAETPFQKAKAVESHLQNDYHYSLSSSSGASADPLDHFLFESRKGHCEFFSTAMAVMLRYLGIPTRSIAGFAAGTYNRFGSYYTVRQADTHSWIEAYFTEQGWIRFDPTPPAATQPELDQHTTIATLIDMLDALGDSWERRVVRYDTQQQIWLLRAIPRTMLHSRNTVNSAISAITPIGGFTSQPATLTASILVACVAATAGLILRRRSKKRAQKLARPEEPERKATALAATELYKKLQNAMTHANIQRDPGTPPLRHAELLVQNNHPSAQAIYLITNAYLNARFGDDTLSDNELNRLTEMIHSVRKNTN